MQLRTTAFLSTNKLSNDPSVISRMFMVVSAGIPHNLMASIRLKYSGEATTKIYRSFKRYA